MVFIPADFNPEERGERAENFFKQGYNCCQSVVLAFADVIKELYGMDERTISALCSGFGGGFGRMREVCGSVSGMTFMAGIIQPASNPSVRSDRTANYALVQEFASEFRSMNGSIVCRELLGLRNAHEEIPVPSERTPEYYKKRPCGQLVRMAATIVANKIVSMQ
ncbi:MAG: C-GCAxxG-C-C family protein [Bacteroidales bacterium]|nr:C-GCAxxG-C-C family protein [Bacteroidales bacterium]